MLPARFFIACFTFLVAINFISAKQCTQSCFQSSKLMNSYTISDSAVVNSTILDSLPLKSLVITSFGAQQTQLGVFDDEEDNQVPLSIWASKTVDKADIDLLNEFNISSTIENGTATISTQIPCRHSIVGTMNPLLNLCIRSPAESTWDTITFTSPAYVYARKVSSSSIRFENSSSGVFDDINADELVFEDSATSISIHNSSISKVVFQDDTSSLSISDSLISELSFLDSALSISMQTTHITDSLNFESSVSSIQLSDSVLQNPHTVFSDRVISAEISNVEMKNMTFSDTVQSMSIRNTQLDGALRFKGSVTSMDLSVNCSEICEIQLDESVKSGDIHLYGFSGGFSIEGMCISCSVHVDGKKHRSHHGTVGSSTTQNLIIKGSSVALSVHLYSSPKDSKTDNTSNLPMIPALTAGMGSENMDPFCVEEEFKYPFNGVVTNTCQSEIFFPSASASASATAPTSTTLASISSTVGKDPALVLGLMFIVGSVIGTIGILTMKKRERCQYNSIA